MPFLIGPLLAGWTMLMVYASIFIPSFGVKYQAACDAAAAEHNMQAQEPVVVTPLVWHNQNLTTAEAVTTASAPSVLLRNNSNRTITLESGAHAGFYTKLAPNGNLSQSAGRRLNDSTVLMVGTPDPDVEEHDTSRNSSDEYSWASAWEAWAQNQPEPVEGQRRGHAHASSARQVTPHEARALGVLTVANEHQMESTAS
jgi:hypothetical protein